jgi:hypothetical protein
LGLVLIIVGVFRGAQAVTAEKNKEIEAVRKGTEKQVKDIRTQQDRTIAELNGRITQLSRKPYAEDLERGVRELLSRMSDEGRRMLLHLLKHAPISTSQPRARLLEGDAQAFVELFKSEARAEDGNRIIAHSPL